ncbi:5-demethoxyubiquinol-8 5-hydroxylase UbiM [Acidisoma cellulosilytica]|uniref:5-demethoxyubiquinol-8 5-hydroxylase UbiM n=1 Tax=Acidisoma cellulosilyticum TaxID=2802395 RepID=A0A964E288_9PROT|nr:5-demethoxyubiquinol-8 5-hydroxylase UbiM [Acidisoma cellulosilyticum]MCB8878987.1 5-demethoxyubiquinol-8 5-hydroxylase UbiM [Acidisoma cellulosilyticum]
MYDVAIIGAGPVGLAFAQSLAGQGFRIAIVERQPESVLADPPFDGREIALTHHSRHVLESLGAWDEIPGASISPLRRAQVMNGRAPHALTFSPPKETSDQPLGFLVPNHLIRGALFKRFKQAEGIALLSGTALEKLTVMREFATLRLADGETITAKLAVAADTRFSQSRKSQGIGAITHDFKRSMMVCRMAHEAPHHETAVEWFDYGQTAALLPVNGQISSVVITRSATDIAKLMAMEAGAFEAEMERSLARRKLGNLRLLSTRHAYPLVATFAHRFVGQRFALIGDAAVGMHPVTAHGFNLGLSGAAILAGELKSAGVDAGLAGALRAYESRHRRASFPLFAGTNAIATLYSKEDVPARIARHAIIGLGTVLPPARRAIAAMLTDKRGGGLATAL